MTRDLVIFCLRIISEKVSLLNLISTFFFYDRIGHGITIKISLFSEAKLTICLKKIIQSTLSRWRKPKFSNEYIGDFHALFLMTFSLIIFSPSQSYHIQIEMLMVSINFSCNSAAIFQKFFHDKNALWKFSPLPLLL